MATFSFDIVSEYDKAEMNNAFLQAQREIANRYDFKGTPAAIEWLDDKTGLKVIGSNEWQIDAVVDIFRKKLASRNLTSKVLDETKTVNEANMRATKEFPFKEGLDQEKAKKITKLLREKLPKVKTQIQGEAVRVSSAKKDELQAAMGAVKEASLDFPIMFTNYR
ncbi:YajQ family cyclic di-GMP-binding protein [Candidatus Saccharibacteria bacterium]|nr:YajQ family cyclic di-GMP-binding protein [Candidatus Saccharibacteria bacterium]